MRPAFLVDPPLALDAEQQQQLQLHYGPERLSSGWWQQQSQHRDYYVGQNAQGQWLWLFRDLQQPEQLLSARVFQLMKPPAASKHS